MPYWVVLALVALVLFFSRLRSVQLTFDDDFKPRRELQKGERRKQLKR